MDTILYIDEVIASNPPIINVFEKAYSDHIEGMIVEFGVATGRSINQIACLFHDKQITGFDSFEGLPEEWRPGYPKGFFKTKIPRVESNVVLISGWFEDTLPGWLESNPGPLSIVHLDADLYSSTSFVLKCITPRLKPGSILVFDELVYPGNYKEHEYKALIEFIGISNFKLEFFGRHHEESYAFKLQR